jgi:hypothetical protein
MDNQTLEKHFADCTLPVKFFQENPRLLRRWERPTSEPFYADIVTQRLRVQYFRIFADAETTLQLVHKQPETHHLLLQVRMPAQQPNRSETVQHWLMGHDERQLFMVNSNGKSSVRAALESLKPGEVRAAEQRGLKVIRQGDWFFIPLRESFTPTWDMLRLHNRAIGNGRHFSLHQHIAEDQVILNGDTDRWGMVNGIYVCGRIRHDEHATVLLPHWHKAVHNTAWGLNNFTGYAD